MPKFTFTIDTGHAPMRNTEDIAAALNRVANLIEPWGRIFLDSGRPVIEANGDQIGAWEVTS